MSPHFLTIGEFPGTGSGILSYRPCWCPSPFPFYISVFFHSLFTCHWISFVFLLYDRRICTHSIGPSVADGEFPLSRFGTGSGTRCWGPRGGACGAHKEEISFKISGVWTSDLAVKWPRTLPLDYGAPRILTYVFVMLSAMQGIEEWPFWRQVSGVGSQHAWPGSIMRQ